MLNLQKKFDQYSTSPQKSDWAAFDKLRSKKKRRFWWWSFIGAGLGFLLLGVYLGAFDASSRNGKADNEVRANSCLNERATVNSKFVPSEPIVVQIDTISSDVSLKQENTLSNNIIHKSSMASTIPFEDELADINNSLQANRSDISDKDEEKDDIQPSGNDILNEVQNSQELLSQASLDLLTKLSIAAFRVIIDEDLLLKNVNQVTPPEELSEINGSSIYAQMGSTFGFINGFAVDAPVNKRGVTAALGYNYNINPILSIGGSIGLMRGIDKGNPDYQLKDSEKIYYLHGHVRFYPLREHGHEVYIQPGYGLTRTDRVLGYYIIDVDGTVTRGLQINSLTGLAVSFQAGYSYTFSDKHQIGAYVNLISHNDGGASIGLSFFKNI